MDGEELNRKCYRLRKFVEAESQGGLEAEQHSELLVRNRALTLYVYTCIIT